jgi:sortase A
MPFGKQKPIYYIGNALMALSFFISVFIYFPVVKMYFYPDAVPIEPGEPFISIPKIKAKAPLLFDVDPWDKATYEPALEKGVAHAIGSGKPGEGKTVYLFAHSSALPWEITRYNTVFLRLSELKNGDDILLSNNEQEYTYQVVDKKVVEARDIEYLTKLEEDQLIIQTCWPIGTDWQRLLVFAKETTH